MHKFHFCPFDTSCNKKLSDLCGRHGWTSTVETLVTASGGGVIRLLHRTLWLSSLLSLLDFISYLRCCSAYLRLL